MDESLSLDDTRAVAALARLAPDDQEVASLRDELVGILDHVATLEQIDVTNVEPMAHPLDLRNRLEADEPGPAMPTEALLRNAPAVEGPFLAVPKVLGDGGS